MFADFRQKYTDKEIFNALCYLMAYGDYMDISLNSYDLADVLEAQGDLRFTIKCFYDEIELTDDLGINQFLEFIGNTVDNATDATWNGYETCRLDMATGWWLDYNLDERAIFIEPLVKYKHWIKGGNNYFKDSTAIDNYNFLYQYCSNKNTLAMSIADFVAYFNSKYNTHIYANGNNIMSSIRKVGIYEIPLRSKDAVNEFAKALFLKIN